MEKLILVTILLFANPIFTSVVKNDADYCFQGGRLSLKKANVRLGHRQCIRDDVSMIKQTYIKTGNDSKGPLYEMHIYRKDVVRGWYECNPKAFEDGPLQLLEVDDDLNMHFSHYACTKICNIKIDKEYARVELTSNGLNYYEVLGTLNQRNWLLSKVHIDLSHTCENLMITCGSSNLKFHACFKQHMECNRFFKNTWIPALIIDGFCTNLELFLFFLFLFICFSLLWLLTKTILCYFLVPIYLPLVYIYSKFYHRFFKQCSLCGLAVHPLQSCGVECICGMVFESTERLKRHRDSALGCKGYKTGIAARKACRSKISNLGLSLFLAVFLFLFITPTIAVQIKISDGRILEASEISNSIQELYTTVEKIQTFDLYLSIVFIFLTLLSCLLLFTKYILERSTLMSSAKCKHCRMFHRFKALCDKSCICGFIDKGESETFLKNLRPITHTASNKCFTKLFRRRSISLDLITFILILAAATTALTGAIAESCTMSSKEEKYVCECLHDPSKDIISLAKKCLSISTDINCGDAPKMIDALKKGSITEDAKIHIDELVKLRRSDLYQMQSHANTTGWFYTLEIISSITGCPTEQQKNADLAEIEINLRVKTPFPCTAEQATAYKKQCECMKGQACDSTNIQPAYQGKQEKFETDLRFLLSKLHRVVPGGFEEVLLHAIEIKDEDVTKHILSKLESGPINSAPTASGYLKVLLKSYSKDSITITSTNRALDRIVKPGNVSVQTYLHSTEIQKLVGTQAIKICPITSDWYAVGCLGLTNRDSINLLACKSKAYKIKTGSLFEVSGNLCFMDQTCDIDMPALLEQDMERIKKMVCSKFAKEKAKTTFINPKDLSKYCKYNGQGTCNVTNGDENISRSVVQCGNEIIHADINHLYQKPEEDHGVFCFDKACKGTRAFIAPFRLSKCDLTPEGQLAMRDIYVTGHRTLEDYIGGIKTSLIQGLKLDKYLPTANLPKHVPIYKHLTIQGSETSEGIASSFIKFSLAAMTGTSAGFHITTPDGKQLFDIVVYIFSSEVSSVYDYAYTTGYTKMFRNFHDEQCTDSCPKSIPGMPKEALAFFKERTSKWGCEEWGCLAINTGCVFGWCQDVISNDARVYQKSTESEVNIRLCISLPTETFCQHIRGAEPSIGETVSAQLSTVQVDHFKTPVLIRDGLAYYGQINNLGSFAPICGSVQKVKKRTFGAGSPIVDYTCHAAYRKDIIIRKCYENFYKSCLLLDKYDVVFGRKTNDSIVLKRDNLNLGNLEVKILLGDINFKQFTEDVEIYYKAKCVGCIDCIEGVSCNIELHSDRDMSCPIKSNDCELFYTRLLIESSKNQYDIKLKCLNRINSIDLTICTNNQKVPLELVLHTDKIEVNNNDSPTYIREEDLRCNTWLCKVYNEGLGGISGILKMIAGDYYYWAAGFFVSVIVLFLFIYILLPLITKFIKNIKDIKRLDDARDSIVRRRLLEQKKIG
ncbi:glycoprotein precursor [Rio Preto da Eva virus]|uniref:Envelopment polyprotein n=1 Tax=Rio Preto da Eva virus TaxID=1538455 RepID=A0A088NCC1_9VIRU|nr:glycoprotein precursor [Rio Preto da Eva virus]AIN55745.1 glycoprotein precursor [Rio Preto da Eva virus]